MPTVPARFDPVTGSARAPARHDEGTYMKVLLVAPQPFFAERGTPIAVRRLAETLCMDGHTVDLLTYPFGENVEVEGLTIHRCRRFPGVRRVRIGFSVGKLLMDLMLLPKLYRLAKPHRYDVIHAVEESVYLALLLRRRHRARVVYDMDSSLADQMAGANTLFRLLRPLLRRVEQWAIRNAEVVAPMCQDLATYASDLRETDDTVVLHDVPVEIEGGGNGSLRPSVVQSPGQCRALYVGNLETYQGIDLLIGAAALLPPHSPVRIEVIGGSEDQVDRLQAIVTRRGLEDRIHFAGSRPLAELHDLLAQADILISPRTNGDNTPLKVYSYMEAGRAILATRLRTHTQVLDDSTALLVEPRAHDIARGLLDLAADGNLRKALGESARRRVRARYSPSSFTSRVRDIYGRSQGRPDVAHYSKASKSSASWSGLERRAARDRRTGRDRRLAARGAHDRRLSERRVLVYV